MTVSLSLYKICQSFLKVEKVFRRSWHILLNELVLGPLLPITLGFIYRKASNFGDKIIQSVIDPLRRRFTFFDSKGFFACGRNRENRNRTNMRKTFSSTGALPHVTYILECPAICESH